jgi:hypothetical protein
MMWIASASSERRWLNSYWPAAGPPLTALVMASLSASLSPVYSIPDKSGTTDHVYGHWRIYNQPTPPVSMPCPVVAAISGCENIGRMTTETPSGHDVIAQFIPQSPFVRNWESRKFKPIS